MTPGSWTPRRTTEERGALVAWFMNPRYPIRALAVARESWSHAAVIDPPRIVRLEPLPIAVLPLVVARAEIQHVMGPGLAELRAAVEAQEVAVTGPWFTHHRRITPELFDFEIGLAVERPIEAAGRVVPSVRPAMTAAQAVHRGGFEALGAAWGELGAWIAREGHVAATDLWERYLVGPESSPRPEEWATELTRPLVDRAG